jgi:hypothetical protein
MARVSQILQVMATLSPQGHPARLALFNYLQNFIPQVENLTAEDMERFYRRCFGFTHWRSNKRELLEQTEIFLAKVGEHISLSLETKQVRKLVESPEFELQREEDVKDIISRFLERRIEGSSQYRLISIPGHRVMAVILNPDRSVQVRMFSNWSCLRAGVLVPLVDDLCLSYTPGLELVPNLIHHIEINPNTSCRFGVNENGCTGVLIRGYTFQRYEVLNGGPLDKHPELAFPLKKLEGFFVQKKDDPVYQQITELLDKSSRLLAHGEPGAVGFALNALEQARHAHENLFANDRMLGLVIRELSDKVDNHISGRAVGPSAP